MNESPPPDLRVRERKSIFKAIKLLAAIAAVLLVGVILTVAVAESPTDRTAWETSNVHGRPGGPLPFRTESIRGLRFSVPIQFVSVPNTTHSLVVQSDGKVFMVELSEQASHPVEIFDAGAAAYGLTLAPDFVDTGLAYMTVGIVDEQSSLIELQRIQLHPKSLELLSARPETLLAWKVTELKGHIGGGLAFDGSGLLLMGIGDSGDSSGSGIAYEVGQDIADLRGSVIRLDVNHPKNRIPDDNPLVHTPKARHEIFAWGLRNPWKLTKEPNTGKVYVFDVGEDNWEAVYELKREANYGWPLYEGSHPFRPNAIDGVTKVTNPVVEHSHAECRAITGGAFYSGSFAPALKGKLIYGDYGSGALYATDLRNPPELIAMTGTPLLEVALDHTGEVVLLSETGEILRLATNEMVDEITAFPTHLSDTGIFQDTSNYVLSPGVVDYDVNASLYSDGARKLRHIAIPNQGKIVFAKDQPWIFPEGTILVKTFVLGEGAKEKRVETRLLHLENGTWSGYTYHWNEENSDATLVSSLGQVHDYTNVNGEKLTWQIPSRTQCMMCHTFGAGFVLGVNTAQLNRQVEREGFTGNQLEYLESLGYFEKGLPKLHYFRGLVTKSAVNTFPRLASPADGNASIEQRAFAYLYANCAHCHRYLGGGNSNFSLNDGTTVINGIELFNIPPIHGAMGLDHPSLIVPGDPSQSVLLRRFVRDDSKRMPKLGTTTIDELGVTLLERWIRSLPTNTPPQETPEL